jgi:hypothetical protein
MKAATFEEANESIGQTVKMQECDQQQQLATASL